MYRDKNSNNKNRSKSSLLIWCFVLVLLAAIATGDIQQSSVKTYIGEGINAARVAVSGGEADVATGEVIKLFKVDEDFGVRDALAMLASMCHENIVPTPSVDGALAFRTLKNVTFEEAMDAILGRSFKYEREGNLIKVYTREEYKKMKEAPERKVYKVLTLYYITAEEAEKLIKPVMSSAAQVQVSTPAEKEISGGGSSFGGASSIRSSGGGDSMALHDTIVIYDYPENIRMVEEIIKALDVRPKQVLVEATILAALLTEGMELGVDWNLMAGVNLVGVGGVAAVQDSVQGGILEQAVAAQNPLQQIASIATGTPIETSGFATIGGGLRIGISAGDVRALITALESVTDTTVLANPKVLTVNKQEGSVLIGTNLGYRSSTTISTGGIATEGEVKFLQTGTQLVFRPYIGNDGYIRMDIYPKDSSATLNEDGVPTESTTQLKTNIIIKDGETIVIGGLFRDVISSTRNQVPLLGDLPLIGGLFRGTSDRTQREEVIVLLTTHIIEEPGEVEGQARADDIRRKRFGAKDGLQWTGRARLAEDRYANAAKYYLDGDYEAAMNELKIVLELRPTYLEALRLEERIIRETDPEMESKIERNVLDVVEWEESSKWLRR